VTINDTQLSGIAAGAATPSSTQQGLTNGSTYYYAVNENGGESAASTLVSAHRHYLFRWQRRQLLPLPREKAA
jgi:hypothetical protein